MADFNIKKGDTMPLLTVTLKDAADAPIDVSTATVQFRMRKDDGAVHVYKVNQAADFVTDGTNGQVEYQFTASDTDTAGNFIGEFVVDFGGGDIQTIPADDYMRIKITDIA